MTHQTTPLPLINTKLYHPLVTGDHLHWTHLLKRLNKNLYRPLTLVSAPSGYGKNTLLSSWPEPCHFHSVWVSLDEKDNYTDIS